MKPSRTMKESSGEMVSRGTQSIIYQELIIIIVRLNIDLITILEDDIKKNPYYHHAIFFSLRLRLLVTTLINLAYL